MKYSEIKNWDSGELKKHLQQTKQSVFTARMKHKMQRLSNTMQLRHSRRDVARLQTALSILPPVPKKPALDGKKSSKLDKNLSKTKKVQKVLKDSTVDKKLKSSPVKQQVKTSVTLDSKKIKTPDTQKTKAAAKGFLPSQNKQQRKTKKWFSFLGSKSVDKGKPSARKSFFRRKSV